MINFSITIALFFIGIAPAVFAQPQTMQIAGVSRNYILYAPTALPPKPPLVFVIHGFNMSGQQEVTLTKMNQVADREKFVVVYPNALPNTSNQQSWDMTGANDYAFLLAIIDSMAVKYKIDENKVYASGFSQGGFMSFQLGCRYADVFAAIAPVSGLLNGSCTPKRPVPMIFTFGTNEGFDVNGFIQSGDTWVKLNSCSTTPKVEKPYPASNVNSVITRSTYSSCQEGAEVVVQSVAGGTHEWPMNTQTKVNNSEEIWAFFKKFSLLQATGIPAKRVAEEQTRVTAFYLNDALRLHGLGAQSEVQVLDYQGKVLAHGVSVGGQFSFKNKRSGVYQLVVRSNGKRIVQSIYIP